MTKESVERANALTKVQNKKIKYDKKLNLICRMAGNVHNGGNIADTVDTVIRIFNEVEKQLTQDQD